MNITEVRITLVDDPKLKAFVTITLGNVFVVRGLKIIEGKTGMFVAMPARKRADGEWQDIAHPVNKEARVILERTILDAYHKELEKPRDAAADARDVPASTVMDEWRNEAPGV